MAKLRLLATSVRPSDLMCVQRSGIARQQRVDVGQEEAGGFAGRVYVALVEGFHHLSDIAAKDGKRVALDQ